MSLDFWDNTILYRTESVHFFVLMNSAAKFRVLVFGVQGLGDAKDPAIGFSGLGKPVYG